MALDYKSGLWKLTLIETFIDLGNNKKMLKVC